jgi:23S rRNA (uracil1939-C5)-methyltransferase
MQQGQIIALEIADLADSGEGIGRYQDLVIFVPNTVPGDRIEAKIVYQKANLAHAQIVSITSPSPHRVRPSCIVADKCGGCDWQSVSYAHQLRIKHNKVLQALQRIGSFTEELLQETMQPIQGAAESLRYRNKVMFPLAADDRSDKVKAGYYQRRSHKLINLNQCPVQDEHFDRFLANIKLDIQTQGWQIYDEKKHRGALRHLGLRIGRRTGQVLLTLVSRTWEIPGLVEQAEQWLANYSDLVGVMLNYNSDRTNAILGKETRCIAGQEYIEEIFAGLRFQLKADTFFQIYTEQAEAMVEQILRGLKLQGTETLIDAYAGIGTLTLPLAKQVKRAIAIESQYQATEQAKINAQINQISNVECLTGTVEQILPQLEVQADVVILDPPRKGCQVEVLEQLRSHPPKQLVYVSCNPATLARDLKILCADGIFQLQQWQPFDFFPQTVHVETLVFLSANPSDRKTLEL